jgi:hypothetical protein
MNYRNILRDTFKGALGFSVAMFGLNENSSAGTVTDLTKGLVINEAINEEAFNNFQAFSEGYFLNDGEMPSLYKSSDRPSFENTLSLSLEHFKLPEPEFPRVVIVLEDGTVINDPKVVILYLEILILLMEKEIELDIQKKIQSEASFLASVDDHKSNPLPQRQGDELKVLDHVFKKEDDYTQGDNYPEYVPMEPV